VAVNAPWRYLTGAHESVQSVLTIFDDVHAGIAAKRQQPRGTLSQQEQELLRSALVLTSSGIDASMTKLVRVALPLLIKKGGGPRSRYNAWLTAELVPAQRVAQPIIAAAISTDPTVELLNAYIAVKTAASYQGSSDLTDRVRDLLCIAPKVISNAEIIALDPFFASRNAIVHDMDYANITDAKKTRRNQHSGSATVAECDRAFQVCAKLIEAAVANL
jgi:hypothetical protein